MSEGTHAVSIKAGELSAAVESAVADVLAKHDLLAGNGLVFGPGTLIGRMLRGELANMNLNAVQKAAGDVAGQVSSSLGVAKGAFSPATFIVDGKILMGFIAREQIQIG